MERAWAFELGRELKVGSEWRDRWSMAGARTTGGNSRATCSLRHEGGQFFENLMILA